LFQSIVQFNLYFIVQVVFNIPNSIFQNTNNFKRKFLVGHLQEAKQSIFVDQIDELIIGTGLAGKARTYLITVETQNITTVEGLISLLEEERSIRQIHLSLHTLDSSKKSYNTELSSEEDEKPAKPIVTIKNNSRRSNTNKKVKREAKVEKNIKVCRTIV
jgi:hypothetical protein